MLCKTDKGKDERIGTSDDDDDDDDGDGEGDGEGDNDIHDRRNIGGEKNKEKMVQEEQKNRR